MGGIHFTFHVFIRLIPPLIPVLTVGLEYPLWKLGMLVSVYFVGSSMGLLPMGVLSDRYDRRATLSGALAAVGVGYLIFSAAPAVGADLFETTVFGLSFDGPFAVMAAAMLLSGIGSSAHVPVGMPIITANAATADRGKVLGVWGGGSKLGDAVGPALIGVLILALGWETILFGFGLLGVVSAFALYAVLGTFDIETRPSDGPADGDDDGAAWANLLSDRRRYLYPMLVLVGYFAAYSVAIQGIVTFVPSFITDVYGYSFSLGSVSFAPESFADFALSLLLVGAAVSRFVGGYLVDRYEHRVVLVATLLSAAAAMFVFSRATLGPVALLVVLLVFGASIWGNSPARDSLVSDLGPAEREGRTFSYLWTASRVFGALSPTAIGFLADSAGYRQGFTYLAASTLVAALFVALLFSDSIYLDADDGDSSAALDD